MKTFDDSLSPFFPENAMLADELSIKIDYSKLRMLDHNRTSLNHRIEQAELCLALKGIYAADQALANYLYLATINFRVSVFGLPEDISPELQDDYQTLNHQIERFIVKVWQRYIKKLSEQKGGDSVVEANHGSPGPANSG